MVDLSSLKNKRVLLLGHRGFLGGAVFSQLQKVGARVATLGNWTDVEYSLPYHQEEPDYVLVLTGRNGGVGYRRSFDIFHANTATPLFVLRHLVKAKERWGWDPKILFPMASCAYGHELDQGNLREEDFLKGVPHPSVDSHGYAKRAVFLACNKVAEQYGLRVITVCPPTLFGPGDRYGEDRAKIMAAMIRRFADAADQNLPEVTCWGTGQPLRQLLYVEDAASLILQALVTYQDRTLLNIGDPSAEYQISTLAWTAADTVRFMGKVNWDTTKPDGQFRKKLNLDRQRMFLGEQTFTPLAEALRQTVDAYRRDRDAGTLR